MLRAFVSVLLICFASQARAQTCPAFFRFVDFGLEGRDGVIYRGGPVFRAEGFDGEPLLLRDRTTCRDVQDLGKDGRGYSIPVVTSITYSPEKTNTDLAELRVVHVADTHAVAEENASAHRDMLDQPGTQITRGASFLCARAQAPQGLSCQFASPYPGNIALVVYCDASTCRMPVLAINAQVLADATWEMNASILDDPSRAGEVIRTTIQQIHNFLAPISSGL